MTGFRTTSKMTLADAEVAGKVRDYIDRNPGKDAEEIARALRLPLAQVVRITNHMLSTGYLDFGGAS